MAHPAPAIARAERRLRLDLVPNRLAQTSARDRQEKPFLTVSDHTYEKSGAPASERTTVTTWPRGPSTKVEVADKLEADYKGPSSLQFAGEDGPGRQPAACDVNGNEERTEPRCLLRRATPKARCRGRAANSAKARSCARDLRRWEPALHRRNDLSRDAVNSVSPRPWAPYTIRSTNFRARVCSGRSRSTTPSSGMTPRPGRTTTSTARTPKSCPIFPRNFSRNSTFPPPTACASRRST